MSAAQDAMNTLTAQWYNTVTQACNLDPSAFQLLLGSQPPFRTSKDLWTVCDATPPLSIVNLYNPSQFNNFSVDYGGVINNLIPQDSNQFQIAMGDYYTPWENYVHTDPPVPSGGILQLFQNWSQMNMPPDQAQQAYTAVQQVPQRTVPVAVELWLNAGGGTGDTKAYNCTEPNLVALLKSGWPIWLGLDSKSAPTDVSNTWAGGEIIGEIDLFWGKGGGQYDQLTLDIANAGITLEVHFGSLLISPVGPIAVPSSEPELSSYQPWYSSAALNMAYRHNDNTVWQEGSPTWDDTFGQSGNMLSVCSALVVVDGIEVIMNSPAQLSNADQQAFQSAAQGGFWPFYGQQGTDGWTVAVSFDDAGNITVTSTLPAGNPQIPGVIATPIAQALS